MEESLRAHRLRMQPTLDELRDLSRRSRKEQRRGLAALTGSAMLFPALGLAWTLAPDRLTEAAYVAAALAGFLLVGYAYAAGQTRGAFRKVFRRLKDERATQASQDQLQHLRVSP